MESPNDEVKVAEQITLYENKIREIKQKIRDELQIRRDLKAKIEEAKKKEALQIQILERLDEYEKIVTKQIQLAKIQEDSDSIKQKSIIQKYENMLNEQQDVWEKYEDQYEQIPLAQEKRKLEISLKKGQIDTQIMQYKINEAKKIMRTLEKINTRREQLDIIEFAKVFVEYKKKEKRFEELYKKEQHLKKKKKDLQAETEYLKQKAAEKAKVINKTLLKTQQLPEIDLSRYSIRKNDSNCDLNFDTVSINSYMLEQEYMNLDDQEPPPSKIQESDSKKRKSTTKKDSSEPMDFKTSEEQVTPHKTKSKQKRVEFNEFGNLVRSNQASQESQMDSMELDDQPQAITGEANPNQSLINVDENPPFSMNSNQHIEYMNPQLCKERPVPSPAKITRHSSQEQQKQQLKQEHLKQQQLYQQKMLQYQQQQLHQQQQKEMEQQHLLQQQQQQHMLQQQHQEQLFQHQQQQLKHQQMHKQQQQQQMMQKQQYQLQKQQQQQQNLPSARRDTEQRNFNMDSSRQIPQSNKPTVKSIEQVHYPNVSKVHNQIQQNTSASTMQMKSAAQRQQETPSTSSMHNLLASPLWQVTLPADLKPSINDPTMMPEIASTSMMSTDLNFFQDNISAILGSEITEPGGSFELKKRLYADSDLNSEAGSIDYEKMYGNISPPSRVNTNLQQRQAEMNNMNSQQQNDKNSSLKPSGQDAAKTFTFGQFTLKQPHNRFF